MTTESERGGELSPGKPATGGPSRSDGFYARVKEADAEAEAAFRTAANCDEGEGRIQILTLFAIAAELRAQRIARRPGAGQ